MNTQTCNQSKTPLLYGRRGWGMRLLKPNLFEGKLFANITLQAEEQGYIEIFDVKGISFGKIQLSSGNNSLDLTTMNLPNGVFIYRVWANNEIKRTDKLIKLK